MFFSICDHVSSSKSNISLIVAVNFCFYRQRTAERTPCRLFIIKAEVSIVSICLELV